VRTRSISLKAVRDDGGERFDGAVQPKSDQGNASGDVAESDRHDGFEHRPGNRELFEANGQPQQGQPISPCRICIDTSIRVWRHQLISLPHNQLSSASENRGCDRLGRTAD
jgi:hypothetical protein